MREVLRPLYLNLTLSECGDVAQYQLNSRPVTFSENAPAICPDIGGCVIFGRQSELTLPLLIALEYADKMQVPAVCVIGSNIACKAAPHKRCPLNTEQFLPGSVDSGDYSLLVEGKVTHRGQLKQLGITVTRLRQGLFRLAQGLVLRDKLKLV